MSPGQHPSVQHSSSPTVLKTFNDPSKNSTSPEFTPAETPPESSHFPSPERADPAVMGDKAEEPSSKQDGDTPAPESFKSKEIDPPNPEAALSSLQQESKNKTATKEKKRRTGPKSYKQKAKAKAKQRIRARSLTSSSSEDSSSTATSSSSSSESSDESSTDEDEIAIRKKKAKARKAKKLKERKKAKARAKAIQSDLESSSEDEPTSSEEERKKSKRKALSKRKRTKKNKTVDDSDEADERDDSVLRDLQAQLNALSLQRRVFPPYGEESAVDGGSRKKGKAKPGKKGSKIGYVRVDKIWDSSKHNYHLKPTAEDPDIGEYDQYVFQVRRLFDWENKYLRTVLEIESKALKETLNDVMSDVKGVSFAEETPEIDPNMIFLYLEEIREHMKKLKKMGKIEKKKKRKGKKISASTKARHTRPLIKYLDKDYKQTKKTLYPLLESNKITFELLWALFKSNEIAYCDTYSNPDEPRAFKIEYANLQSSFVKGKFYEIEGRYLEYDGKIFGMGSMEIEVPEFTGPRNISSLACYPLKYHKDAEKLKEQLVERGKKFVSLKGMQYRFHKGMAFYKKKRQVIKVNINGRVMIDPAIHRRINPNYPISTVKPMDPDLLDDEDEEDSDSCNHQSSSDEEGLGQKVRDQFGETDKPITKWKVVEDDDGNLQVVQIEVDSAGNAIQKEDMNKLPGQDDDSKDPEFTEEDLLIASPVALGFAFSEKLWLEISVSGIKEIEWNEGAYDSLVLPDNQKAIVKGLVRSHTFEGSHNIDDVIQGKGQGLVAVMHGPPGTGKTLTAEGTAELLKRPLYMVSVGELGTRPNVLETELNKILDVAHSWGAVLLLDEADVFLEARKPQDVERNALVSIFLRLLEYFQGILFLTTNRVETFDPAFHSRIHVALRYGELTNKAKRAVWKNFVKKVEAIDGAKVKPFSEDDYDRLSRRNVNGRQIKNAVRTAQALALDEGKPLTLDHVLKVLDVGESFERDLKGGIGYLEAMRSYH